MQAGEADLTGASERFIRRSFSLASILSRHAFKSHADLPL